MHKRLYMKLFSVIIKWASIAIFIVVCVIFAIDQRSLHNSSSTLQWDFHLVQSKTPWNLYFITTGTTAFNLRKQLESQMHQPCTVVNGSYFGYTASGDFQPAWAISTTEQPNIVTQIWSDIDVITDQNITTLLKYKKHPLWVVFGPKDSNPIDPEYDYSFYAGPLIIDWNMMMSGEIDQSTHGRWKYYRTFRILWANALWVTKKPMTLYELWWELQMTDRFAADKVVVNLDWWPSTSISSAEYSFNENQKLPRFFYSCN